MKLLTAIKEADELRPNKAPQETKAKWLMQLEGEFAEMMHEEMQAIPEGISDDSIGDTELLMPYPHDQVYVSFLCAKIDLFVNHDEELYAVDKDCAEKDISEAKAWYRRNNRPDVSGSWKVM